MSQANGVKLLFATGQQLYHSLYTGIEGVANLCISIILVQFYGIVGVALGTSISMIFVRVIIHPYYVSRACGIPVKEYYYIYSAPMMKSAVVISLFYLIIQSKLEPNYLMIFIQTSLYCLMFLVVFIVWILDEKERKSLIAPALIMASKFVVSARKKIRIFR